jgi:catecholate siderophore receptor
VREGTYTVTAVAPGFTPTTVTVVTRRNQETTQQFLLSLASVREDVTVNAPPGYSVPAISSATRTMTPLRDVPQSVTVVSDVLIKDQLMTSMADVMRYVPGVQSHQGENNRDQVIIRGNSSSADFYQNFVPGAANTDASLVTLTSDNNATDRTNLFNQTDVTVAARTRPIAHTLLAGTEFGRQLTDNFRNTGFFNNAATSLIVPFASPQTTVPVTFRQSATDADNHLRTNVAAVFVQDQIVVSPAIQLLAGLRYDHFGLQYHNNRTREMLERPDDLLSPRAGIVIKPVDAVSLYGRYSVSYLPSSGDRFASLTSITQQVEPERFDNCEVGTKWDSPLGLAMTAAVYRLDRTNTRSTAPNDPTRIIQTGAQRTNGFELGLTETVVRDWTVAGGYAYQDAYVRRATTSAIAGATVGQVPHHTFSLWNTVQLHCRLSAGLGLIQRSDMFAAIDNTVVLPGYVRADAAAYFTINRQARLQVNVENLANTTYYVNADSNTNISPGSPRAIRLALITRF